MAASVVARRHKSVTSAAGAKQVCYLALHPLLASRLCMCASTWHAWFGHPRAQDMLLGPWHHRQAVHSWRCQKSGLCLPECAPPSPAAAGPSRPCPGPPLLRLTRSGSLLVTSTVRCSACLYGCHWTASMRACQAAGRHLNLQLCQPRAAHRPPAWVRRMWSLGRVAWAAGYVYARRLLRSSRVSDGRGSALIFARARTLRMCDQQIAWM